MKLIELNENNFKVFKNYNEFYKFSFNDIEYELTLKNHKEVYMSYYFFEDVKFFKNKIVIESGRMQDSGGYYDFVSPNKKFILLNLKKLEIINLETNQKTENIKLASSFRGNEFNESSSKVLIKGNQDFIIIDLLTMNETYKSSNNCKDAFFYDNDKVWIFFNNNSISELNLNSNTVKQIKMESPFSKFNIDIKKYQSLIDLNTHCLALPKGGMSHSINLNKWEYLNTKDKLVFKTLIPISDINYSEGYKINYCSVKYKYVELIKNITS